jgi:hypothetical protein
VRAAPVRIQRPPERHALHGIQGGTAPHFLVPGIVCAALGLAESFGAALFHHARNVTHGRMQREGEELGVGDSHQVRLLSPRFVLYSPL